MFSLLLFILKMLATRYQFKFILYSLKIRCFKFEFISIKNVIKNIVFAKNFFAKVSFKNIYNAFNSSFAKDFCKLLFENNLNKISKMMYYFLNL